MIRISGIVITKAGLMRVGLAALRFIGISFGVLFIILGTLLTLIAGGISMGNNDTFGVLMAVVFGALMIIGGLQLIDFGAPIC